MAERQLGKLVHFQKRSDTVKAADAPKPHRKAQILMFTGVRYERDTSSLPPKPSQTPRAKRKRG
jgi:hypothetical protein